MKFTRNISIMLLALGVAGLSSCLKDAKSNTDASLGTNNVVEFQNSSVPISYSSDYPQYNNGVTLTGDTGGFNVNINWAGAQFNAPEDITVTIAIDTAALDAFNVNQATNFVLPPSDVYSLPTTIVIKKGTNTTLTRVTATSAADYDYTQSYCLPLTITSSSYGIVSTNFGTAMYTFILNNIYADTYTTTGYFFRSVSTSRAISGDYAVGTAGASSNTFPVGDLPAGGTDYYFNANVPAAGGAVTGYVATGSTPAAPASGFMTSDNPGNIDYSYNAPIIPGVAPWVSSTYNNTYDATNKIFWLHVGYGSGATSQTGFNRQVYMKMVAD